MTVLASTKTLGLAVLAMAAIGASQAAHARSDVFFSVGVQPAPVYVQPAPVYRAPAPVYVQPAPVYVQPAAPVYYGSPWEAERARRWAEWRHREWERRQWEQRHHGRHWD